MLVHQPVSDLTVPDLTVLTGQHLGRLLSVLWEHLPLDGKRLHFLRQSADTYTAHAKARLLPDGVWVQKTISVQVATRTQRHLALVTGVGDFRLQSPQKRRVAAGPDGALWFVERDANKIGRIGPFGTLTEYALPHPNSQPEGIASGADGNLWFPEKHGNRIGRISPSGTITEYPLLHPDSQPEGMLAGTDGTLWFTEQGGKRVGRITSTGAIMDMPCPHSRSFLVGGKASPEQRLQL